MIYNLALFNTFIQRDLKTTELMLHSLMVGTPLPPDEYPFHLVEHFNHSDTVMMGNGKGYSF